MLQQTLFVPFKDEKKKKQAATVSSCFLSHLNTKAGAAGCHLLKGNTLRRSQMLIFYSNAYRGIAFHREKEHLTSDGGL